MCVRIAGHVLRHPASIALVAFEGFTAAHLAAGDRGLIEPRFHAMFGRAQLHHVRCGRALCPAIGWALRLRFGVEGSVDVVKGSAISLAREKSSELSF